MRLFLSLDSGTDAQVAALRNEVDLELGGADLDPLEILIAAEEYFDDQLAETLLSSSHRMARKRQIGIYRRNCDIVKDLTGDK